MAPDAGDFVGDKLPSRCPLGPTAKSAGQTTAERAHPGALFPCAGGVLYAEDESVKSFLTSTPNRLLTSLATIRRGGGDRLL